MRVGVTASCVRCNASATLSDTPRCAVLCCCHVQVPPYILYVARAFSTLEGIGLSANDDYSIVSEAYPYLSKRLLTDDSPRAKAALRSMVYGGSDRTRPTVARLCEVPLYGEGFTLQSSATSSTRG